MTETAETIDAAGCAQLLQCTTQTVEELTRKGELPGIKFGRGWVYVKADLLAWLAQRARQEAQDRRQEHQARMKRPAFQPPHKPKPRRLTPPALPQPTSAAPNLHS